MFDDYQDAINKRLIEVKHVGLTDLQRAVDKALKREFANLFISTIPYEPKPKYWMDKILSEEN